MNASDTLFATARLTLGLCRKRARSPEPKQELITSVSPNDVLDKRKRKRNEESEEPSTHAMLTPGNTPLPKTVDIDLPLLAHRYAPISVAGDGAFSCTILAYDTLHPQNPVVAIKAMKPSFEIIGQREYNLLRRIGNLPMPKHTSIPIVQACASFSASSTYHLVLEALDQGQLSLPQCPHQPRCCTLASCPSRQNALRKVASQLLLGLSILHDQIGYIHADLKPENILRCRTISPTSMKLKLIDLGNAVHVQQTHIYYDDFEVQSTHYRAPEVLLGLSFGSAIDIFSLGLILSELLLLQPQESPRPSRRKQPSFPSSPPQSHSPPLLRNFPLLASGTSTRRAFIAQIINLFGPLPPLYRAGKYWNDDIAKQSNGGELLLSQQMENEGVDAELIDFIMRMLELDPEKRITAREALRHEWLLGPLLGYWAALGVEWINPENDDRSMRRMNSNMMTGESVESRSSSPKPPVSPKLEKTTPRMVDFSAKEMMDEDEDQDEVFQMRHADSTPVKPPANIVQMEPDEQDDDEVLML